MKYRVISLILLVVWPVSVLPQNRVVASVARMEGSVVRVPVRNDSHLWLEGTSNVRDWTCKATAMSAAIHVDAEGASEPSELMAMAVRGVSVKVPVRMLKCGDRHMEANMYNALKAPEPPAASYIVAEFDRIPKAALDGTEVTTAGRMTVAGVERTVEMTVRTDLLPDGTRRAIGRVPILMTDFGITPPHPWMGILRTGNRVVVQFEIFISPEALREAQGGGSSSFGDH